MDVVDLAARLDAQDRMLHAIVEALAPAPSETETSGFEDLIETLAELMEAVADVTQAVRALRSPGCAHCRQGAG
ncbi:hypothetical protein SAMN05192568_100577 [Methylobacterium pseudosasicola]|uniref:Histidine kinase n=1 Tax=Methylobacterium pseudosasicola TaxID=582667 RepID=A0A1I4HV87_9HYPH|nr:hypothetical protein [Methylobacterium pseudosasicola]SFL46014.1 hypothetical protein SAMN05192568_100577 [Methylobacterium pseudosasicola]